jgi:diguanylate cyclase (GGDEF)-like protein
VLQLSGGKATWRRVLQYSLPALALGTAVAWLLPSPEAQGALISGCRLIIPMFALWRLWPLLRTSRGAGVLLAGTALGSLSSGALLARTLALQPLEPAFIIGADIISVFVGTMGLLLWHQERVERRLAQTAMTDALTGALNRHGLMPRLEQELARAQRTGRTLSLVLCDLDHFKRINDQHGHAVGDAVLKQFSKLAGRMIRRHDVFGRWGGEEFLLLLPEASLEQAVRAAERLRRAQAQPRDGLPAVTLSAGVVCAPHAGWGYCSAAELLASADHLLYVAKETRNRVVSLGTLEHEPVRPAEPTTVSHSAPDDAFAQTLPPAPLR